MSDIDAEVVDGLKVLDPKRPIREADIPLVADLGTGVAFWQRNHQHNLFIENLCCAYLTSAGLRIFTYPIIV